MPPHMWQAEEPPQRQSFGFFHLGILTLALPSLNDGLFYTKLGAPPVSPSVNGAPSNTGATASKPIPTPNSRLSRSNSVDRQSTPPLGTSPQRRSSWFSNISSKFSGTSPVTSQVAPVPENKPLVQPRAPVSSRPAVLPQGGRNGGDAPYTPAPPRANSGGNLLDLFRRLSSGAASLGHGARGNHGLVERRVLNVDDARERCKISELNQAKLRRVAFCVDVEIAPQPKYVEDASRKKKSDKKTDQPEKNGAATASKETAATEANGVASAVDSVESKPAPGSAKDNGSSKKKKEKKKKSEEERKARKEKKRKLAEANGTIPMEIHRSSSDSSLDTNTASGTATPKISTFPTTNPVRIYRRCCQLRETPILKKITEQLSDASNYSTETGIVEKLDLSGYWMQLPDLITLGDYLAVVPVKEVFLEECGLTDEGLRVVLAGLLAAKKPDSKRRRYANYSDHSMHGGVIERLVLKNNKIGPEGWKHVCLFIYLSRSLKFLDLSGIPFPNPARPPAQNGELSPPTQISLAANIAYLLSRSLGERLAGSDLELLNLGETCPAPEQLGVIIDGAIQCGLRRLGLARNNITEEGVAHVARYLEVGKCEGLDLCGNDLRDHIEALADAIGDDHKLWALSLADCNLGPTAICKVFPPLLKLGDFRFIDLSHNPDLFQSETKAMQALRRYLPKMPYLKRIHLADVSMTSEQAIALAEVLPEVPQLAHISLQDNPDLTKLADARTEEAQEEACALYASLLAAARVSKTLVSVDIDVPTEESGEVVKALAKQVVAYCLRNMERLQVGDLEDPAVAEIVVPYPDVLAHLVGREETGSDEIDIDTTAPDDDYVIGGTGVVKALACCLDNKGDESRRPSFESLRGTDSGVSTPGTRLPSGRAKNMSKHLLSSARKIRARLQPALARAKEHSEGGEEDLRKLIFLEATLNGIIKRFEDEFPETREVTNGTHRPLSGAADVAQGTQQVVPSLPDGEDSNVLVSDVEDDENSLHIRPISRSSSLHANTKPLDLEEGRMHRRGHRFRTSIVHPFEKYEEVLVASLDEMGENSKHLQMLREMIDDLNDPALDASVAEKGLVRTFKEERALVAERLRDVDPEHWEKFRESQVMARKNINVDESWLARVSGETAIAAADPKNESAIE
ncbi:hypothetical protein jhhlp_006119 [Lomentospora prolificans]|uniref:Cell wall biogenesis protein Mhp1 n=1 Tax=Lomentospora prolificans TaxID=41688 RepID=A0A2N3N512_9PEZI|nr:hypothetical protein jhhlp_006119 [Lomentospora prolificans]